MGLINKCRKCGYEFERPYLSRPKCPKCGSKDLLLIKPSRGTGLILLSLGLLMWLIALYDIFTGFWPSRIGVSVLIFLGLFFVEYGAVIAFGRRE